MREHADCPHEKLERHRVENDDRIRTMHYCVECRTFWWGCFAKRLGEDGEAWWGLVGVWNWTPHDLPLEWVA